MTAATKTPGKAAPRRKAAAPRRVADDPQGNGVSKADPDQYQAPTEIRAPKEFKPEPVAEHPLYGAKKVYTYQPKDGSESIVFPHISTCQPTPLFFYDNRHMDEMHQAFAWMDLCGVPDSMGRRLFMLSGEEQGKLLREWFGGLNLSPAAGVSPPGES